MFRTHGKNFNKIQEVDYLSRQNRARFIAANCNTALEPKQHQVQPTKSAHLLSLVEPADSKMKLILAICVLLAVLQCAVQASAVPEENQLQDKMESKEQLQDLAFEEHEEGELVKRSRTGTRTGTGTRRRTRSRTGRSFRLCFLRIIMNIFAAQNQSGCETTCDNMLGACPCFFFQEEVDVCRAICTTIGGGFPLA